MDGAGTSIHASALREQRALSLNTPAVAGKRAITLFAPPHSFFRVLAGWEVCRPCCCQNQCLHGAATGGILRSRSMPGLDAQEFPNQLADFVHNVARFKESAVERRAT
jgi:hypothetical protein